MHPRAIDNNELGIVLSVDSIDLTPGRLRPPRDNGNLGSHNLVQQTRLADIWPAHQRDNAKMFGASQYWFLARGFSARPVTRPPVPRIYGYCLARS